MNFTERIKKVWGAVKNSPPAKNLQQNFDDNPVKAVGVGSALLGGAAALGVGAMEMNKGHEFLTPEGVSYSEPAPEIPGEKVENVKLTEAPKASE